MKTLRLLMCLYVIFYSMQASAQNISAHRNILSQRFKNTADSLKNELDRNLKSLGIVTLAADGGDNKQATSIFYSEKIRRLNPSGLLVFRRDELDTLLGPNKEGYLVTPSNFNKIIQSKFETLSGTEIKNGKYFGSSVSVDTKSVTVNISIKPSASHEFYLMPTISGTSTNGFTTVITGDKYSKTLSGGLGFIVLSANNSSKFETSTAMLLHNNLKLLRYRNNKIKPNSDSLYFERAFDTLRSILNDKKSADFLLSYFRKDLTESQIDPSNLRTLKQYNKVRDTLVKAKLLPKTFDTLSFTSYKMAMIDSHEPKDVKTLAMKNYLDSADKVQQKAAFSSQYLHWFGGGVKYNVANCNIIAPASTKLVQNFANEYFSANVYGTWMKLLSNGNHFYFSPTYTIQNPHNFKTTDQLHAEVFQDYLIGSAKTQKINKDLTFYASVPGRIFTNYLTLPLAYYNTKWGFGAELDYKVGWNDVSNDNEDLTFGVLIPIQSDKSAIVVEPLIKAQMLNQKITAFWSNNIVFGVNVTVAIPKSFFN